VHAPTLAQLDTGMDVTALFHDHRAQAAAHHHAQKILGLSAATSFSPGSRGPASKSLSVHRSRPDELQRLEPLLVQSCNDEQASSHCLAMGLNALSLKETSVQAVASSLVSSGGQ
jgi:hypothetical protein